MAEKRVSVRLAAVGGRQVWADLEGVGEAGKKGFGRLTDPKERHASGARDERSCRYCVAVHRPNRKTGGRALTPAGAAVVSLVCSVKKLGTRRFVGTP